MADPQSDPVADILKRAPLAPAEKADLWDAFYAAKDEDDLAARLATMPKLSQTVKADLWDLKSQPDAAPAADQQTAEEQGSGGATLGLTAARMAPAAVQKAAGFAANHPSATQKIINAGMRTVGGAIGAKIGGVPGAVVGASVSGVTPTQQTIREVAGRMAGEAAPVAKQAGKAVAITNYAKETSGLKVAGSDIINKPKAANAIEHYANSLEKGILRLYGPSGEVVSGPSAVAADAAPKAASAAAKLTASTSWLRKLIGEVLGPLSAATGITDFAQTVEPTRQDIGIMGIGHSVDRSEDEKEAHPALLNHLLSLKELGEQLTAAADAALGKKTDAPPVPPQPAAFAPRNVPAIRVGPYTVTEHDAR